MPVAHIEYASVQTMALGRSGAEANNRCGKMRSLEDARALVCGRR